MVLTIAGWQVLLNVALGSQRNDGRKKQQNINKYG